MNYDTFKMPNGATTVRPAGNGTCTLDDLVQEMETNTTLTKADGLAAITFIKDYLARQLSRGVAVSIDGLGQFAISLKLDSQKDEGAVSGNDVQMKRVTFKAASTLKQAIAEKMTAERVSTDDRNEASPRHNIDERREIARALADKMYMFSAEDYRRHAVVSSATASLDLRRFMQEGWMQSRNVGRSRLYSLKS